MKNDCLVARDFNGIELLRYPCDPHAGGLHGGIGQAWKIAERPEVATVDIGSYRIVEYRSVAEKYPVAALAKTKAA